MFKRLTLCFLLAAFVLAFGCQRKKHKRKKVASRSAQVSSRILLQDSTLAEVRDKNKRYPFGKRWKTYHYKMLVNQTGQLTLLFKDKRETLRRLSEKVKRGEEVSFWFATRKVKPTKSSPSLVRYRLQIKKKWVEGHLNFHYIPKKKPTQLGGDGFAMGMSDSFELAIPSFIVLRSWLWCPGMEGMGSYTRRNSFVRNGLTEVKNSVVITQNRKPVDPKDKRIAWWFFQVNFTK
ncbi:MAG: hypothetical protein EP343_01295 [Deltaproteobacteria bacterium]|nr:MAG: hypothetical protein EP343_01295 [Deltaproteobacteria bacterium]